MVDFRRLLTPELRAKWDQYREFEADQKARYRQMSNENLIASAQYCLGQMGGPREWGPGAPVYDSAFFHAILPEMMDRLRNI